MIESVRVFPPVLELIGSRSVRGIKARDRTKGLVAPPRIPWALWLAQ